MCRPLVIVTGQLTPAGNISMPPEAVSDDCAVNSRLCQALTAIVRLRVHGITDWSIFFLGPGDGDGGNNDDEDDEDDDGDDDALIFWGSEAGQFER